MASLGVVLSGGSLIDLDGTIFIQLGIFWIAFVVLYFLVFKPMLRLFDARYAAIEGTRKEAAELQKAAADQVESFERRMRDAKLAAVEERDRMRVEAVRLERRILDKVRAENQTLLTDSERRLGDEAGRIRKDLVAQVPAIARQIAARLLGREPQ